MGKTRMLDVWWMFDNLLNWPLMSRTRRKQKKEKRQVYDMIEDRTATVEPRTGQCWLVVYCYPIICMYVPTLWYLWYRGSASSHRYHTLTYNLFIIHRMEPENLKPRPFTEYLVDCQIPQESTGILRPDTSFGLAYGVFYITILASYRRFLRSLAFNEVWRWRG
jgi:hypothetical protein